MSAFETGCLEWYGDYAGNFGMESGITAEIFSALNLGQYRPLFLRGLEAIHTAYQRIQADRIKQARGNG